MLGYRHEGTNHFISTTSSAENEVTKRRDVDNVVLGVGSGRLEGANERTDDLNELVV